MWDSLFTAMNVHATELIQSGVLEPWKPDITEAQRRVFTNGMLCRASG